MKIYTAGLKARGKRRECWRALFLPYTLFVCLFSGVAIFFGLAVTLLGIDDGSFTCQPNGHVLFPWEYGSITTWDGSQFLSITLGFGTFSFAEAKIIDICWDLLVGRGGQALLVFYCYPLFRRSFTRIMEHKEAPFPLFSAIVFDRISLNSTAKLGASITSGSRKRRQARSKHDKTSIIGDWRLPFLFMAFAYLLAWPTILSSVTGYQSNQTAYVRNPADGNLVPASGWQRPDLVVHDGSRVGLSDDFPVCSYTYHRVDIDAHTWTAGGVPNPLYQVLGSCYDQSSWSANGDVTPPTATSDTTTWTYNLGNFSLCFFTLPIKSTNLRDSIASSVRLQNHTYNLTSPALLDVENNDRTYQVVNSTVPRNDYYAFGNLTLTRAQIVSNGECEPAKTYQWGFSSLPLCILWILSTIFSVILLVLHQDAYDNGQADRYAQRYNHYRDALDLVTELRNQLGQEVNGMPAEELKALIDKEQGGMAVEASDLVPSRKEEKKATKLRKRQAGRRRSSRTVRTLFSWRSARSRSRPGKGDLSVEEEELELHRPLSER